MRNAIIPLAIAGLVAFAPTAHADGASVSADANCTTFTVHASGLQAGDRLVVEQGSQAPYGFVMGSGVYWQFAVDEAAGTANVALPATAEPWFTADVLVIHDGSMTGLFHQMVDCNATAPEVDPTTVTVVEPVVTVAPEPVAAPVVERARRVSERLLRFGLR